MVLDGLEPPNTHTATNVIPTASALASRYLANFTLRNPEIPVVTSVTMVGTTASWETTLDVRRVVHKVQKFLPRPVRKAFPASTKDVTSVASKTPNTRKETTP